MPRKSTPPSIDVVVTVTEDQLPNIREVADRLSAEGLEVGEVMSSVGVIAGKAGRRSLAQLGRVKGVAAVERADGVQIAPPDAGIQ